MKKMLLLLLCAAHINGFAGTQQKQSIKANYPSVPWEVMGASEKNMLFTRVERLKTPEGWIVKILTMSHFVGSTSALDSVSYMYIPDLKHEWQFYPDSYQKLIDIK